MTTRMTLADLLPISESTADWDVAACRGNQHPDRWFPDPTGGSRTRASRSTTPPRSVHDARSPTRAANTRSTPRRPVSGVGVNTGAAR